MIPAKPVKHESPPPRPREPLVPRLINLLELGANDCRFPYGDAAPFQFCGCPKLPESPYCRDHTELCLNSPTHALTAPSER